MSGRHPAQGYPPGILRWAGAPAKWVLGCPFSKEQEGWPQRSSFLFFAASILRKKMQVTIGAWQNRWSKICLYTTSLNQSLAKDRREAPPFSAILRVFIIPLSAKFLYTFSILYPMPICVWIYCGESGSDSSFLRSVAIKTRSEATSLFQELPQTSWVI